MFYNTLKNFVIVGNGANFAVQKGNNPEHNTIYHVNRKPSGLP